MASKDFDFEKALKELDEIASKLENTQTSLDESILLFEKGVKLSKECTQHLEKAKQKIATLTQEESVIND
ncbi:MAG: exodeoxyribonuclease VII small subunit [Clostridia bacterium]|nr:exodeoxyribonuclease VII small subunit [Clostridia bacterium]